MIIHCPLFRTTWDQLEGHGHGLPPWTSNSLPASHEELHSQACCPALQLPQKRDTKRFTICAKESLSQWVVVGLSTPRSQINQIIHKVCCKMQHKVMHFQVVLQVNLRDRWRHPWLFKSKGATGRPKHGGPATATVTRHRPAPFVLVHGQGLVGAVENQRRTTFLKKENKQTPRHSNTQTASEIYHAKHTQNGFNPKP